MPTYEVDNGGIDMWKILEIFTGRVGKEKIERLSMTNQDGDDIQVIRYNGDSSDVVVKVNSSMTQTNLDEVPKVIKNKL